jgi:hypothetical protein
VESFPARNNLLGKNYCRARNVASGAVALNTSAPLFVSENYLISNLKGGGKGWIEIGELK